MKRILLILACVLIPLSLFAQVDRSEVRAGNRKFKKNNFKESEIDYRKALIKDSTSFAGAYNLASALYREGNYDEAGKSLESLKENPSIAGHEADYYFNLGDVALQKKDYGSAVKAFRESLLRNPADIAAKENYIYAKKMLQDQQNQQQQNQDNQDQQNQDNKDNQDQQQQDQNQNQEQNQDQQQQQQQQQPQQISKQQAQQMLKAVQAQEKKTQDKVKKEKAELLKSKEKEKNW